MIFNKMQIISESRFIHKNSSSPNRSKDGESEKRSMSTEK